MTIKMKEKTIKIELTSQDAFVLQLALETLLDRFRDRNQPDDYKETDRVLGVLITAINLSDI